jgi:Bacterial regulatory proteins, luxR family
MGALRPVAGAPYWPVWADDEQPAWTLERPRRRPGRLGAARVAGALFMSPKTVEAHLSRIYRKLGVRSRAELAHKLTGQRG